MQVLVGIGEGEGWGNVYALCIYLASAENVATSWPLKSLFRNGPSAVNATAHALSYIINIMYNIYIYNICIYIIWILCWYRVLWCLSHIIEGRKMHLRRNWKVRRQIFGKPSVDGGSRPKRLGCNLLLVKRFCSLHQWWTETNKDLHKIVVIAAQD